MVRADPEQRRPCSMQFRRFTMLKLRAVATSGSLWPGIFATSSLALELDDFDACGRIRTINRVPRLALGALCRIVGRSFGTCSYVTIQSWCRKGSDLGREPVGRLACHSSTFSEVGASDQPGAVQFDAENSFIALPASVPWLLLECSCALLMGLRHRYEILGFNNISTEDGNFASKVGGPLAERATASQATSKAP
jgi:hypothetical protein